MFYKDWIEQLKKEWKGKEVKYKGETHKVVGIDYNGLLLIDRPTEYNTTTAIASYMIEQ